MAFFPLSNSRFPIRCPMHQLKSILGRKRNPARSFVQPELGEPVKWSSFQQPQTT